MKVVLKDIERNTLCEAKIYTSVSGLTKKYNHGYWLADNEVVWS